MSLLFQECLATEDTQRQVWAWSRCLGVLESSKFAGDPMWNWFAPTSQRRELWWWCTAKMLIFVKQLADRRNRPIKWGFDCPAFWARPAVRNYPAVENEEQKLNYTKKEAILRAIVWNVLCPEHVQSNSIGLEWSGLALVIKKLPYRRFLLKAWRLPSGELPLDTVTNTLQCK